MKIAILLSSYNGEKYIREQIESIKAQTYWQFCTLFIRDDGSKDSTFSIIEKYADNSKIFIEKGENIGYAKSFNSLLKNHKAFDYYSFADQDDFWYPNKIERAITKLQEENNNIPLMYFANCDYTDKDLNIIGKRSLGNKKFTFEKSLFDCWALGFTIVINNNMRELMIQTDGTVGHDHFAEMIANAFGKQLYDTESCAKYRRHENNVTTSRNNKLQIKKAQLKQLFFGKGFKNNFQTRQLLPLCSGKISKSQYNMLNALAKDKRSIKDKITLFFYQGRFKESLIKEIVHRFLFLVNKI